MGSFGLSNLHQKPQSISASSLRGDRPEIPVAIQYPSLPPPPMVGRRSGCGEINGDQFSLASTAFRRVSHITSSNAATVFFASAYCFKPFLKERDHFILHYFSSSDTANI